METQTYSINEEELKKRLGMAATGNPADAHGFFAQFAYNLDLENHNFLVFFDKAIMQLQVLNHLNPKAFEKIHKGVPYYFLGIASFFLHNYSNAVYFFDAAVSEDMHNDPGARTPAIMFLELDGDSKNQAARELTQKAEGNLSKFITFYNKLSGSKSITTSEFREKLLKPSVSDRQNWRTLATSIISYLLEWEYLSLLRDIRAKDGTWEPFLIHLFKGCVIFESLLKANPSIPKPGNDLGEIINKNINIKSKLGISRNLKTYGPSLESIISSLSNSGNSVEYDIECAMRLRNTIGHNIGWATSLTTNQYVTLVCKVMNAVIHTISTLY